MSVRLLFPMPVFQYNLLEEGLIDEMYLHDLKADMDGMRRKDPVGRQISNAYTGWQSNDGVEARPAWTKWVRILNTKMNCEVLPFFGVNPTVCQLSMGNAWANINDKGSWNRPHGHNGCFLSGAFYVHADGDEGDFVALNSAGGGTVLSDFPPCPRIRENHCISPTSGTLLIFPSGCIHMVEPNQTNKDRYSVAFNSITNYLNAEQRFDNIPIDPDWNLFNIQDGELTK